MEEENYHTLVVALAPKQTIDLEKLYQECLDCWRKSEYCQDRYREEISGEPKERLLKFALDEHFHETFFLDADGQRFKYGSCKSFSILLII